MSIYIGINRSPIMSQRIRPRFDTSLATNRTWSLFAATSYPWVLWPADEVQREEYPGLIVKVESTNRSDMQDYVADLRHRLSVVMADLADNPDGRVTYHELTGTEPELGRPEAFYFRNDAVDSARLFQSLPGDHASAVGICDVAVDSGPGDRRRHFCRKGLDMVELVEYILAAEDGIIISEQFAEDAAQDWITAADREATFRLTGSYGDEDFDDDDEVEPFDELGF